MDKLCLTLTLELNQYLTNEIYRLTNGSTLQFLIGNSLIGMNLRFFTNYPDDSQQFSRDKYYELQRINPQTKPDEFDNHFVVNANLCGVFRFYYTSDGGKENLIGDGYFMVEPRLSILDQTFQLNDVVFHSYVSSKLGRFSDWLLKLAVSKNSGYNFIHFTPLQKLNHPKLTYCIHNHILLNPIFDCTWENIQELVKYLSTEWEINSMTDLVYNHIAVDSCFIRDNPLAAYNLKTSPHLRPAFVVDCMLWNLTVEIQNEMHIAHGIDPNLVADWQLDLIRDLLWQKIYLFQLHEYLLVDINKVLKEFKSYVENNLDYLKRTQDNPGPIRIYQDTYRRNETKVNIKDAALIYYRETLNIDDACEQFVYCLEYHNNQNSYIMEQNLQKIVNNVMSSIYHRFISPKGEKLGDVSESTPLTPRYFNQPFKVTEIQEIDNLLTDESKLEKITVFDGWIDGQIRDFLAPDCNAYFVREMNILENCTKLKYGNKINDYPLLWNMMKDYTEMTVKIFSAVKFVNCHLTPIHVLKWLADQARLCRNDLFIIAELPSSYSSLKNTLVNQVGVNSFVEDFHGAKNTYDIRGTIDYHTEQPLGSFIQPLKRKLIPSPPRVIWRNVFSISEKYLIQNSNPLNILPLDALMCFTQCGLVCDRNFEEMDTIYFNSTTDPSFYMNLRENVSVEELNKSSLGIIESRRVFNFLHGYLIREKYYEQQIEQFDFGIFMLKRHNPHTRRSYVLVTRLDSCENQTHSLPDLPLPGLATSIILEARTGIKQQGNSNLNESFLLEDFKFDLSDKSIIMLESTMVSIVENIYEKESHCVKFENFPPGSIVIMDVKLSEAAQLSCHILHNFLLKNLTVTTKSVINEQHLSPVLASDEVEAHQLFLQCLRKLSLSDMNFVLYRCEVEEQSDDANGGSYCLENMPPLEYCGLQSVQHILNQIRIYNNLHHPLCRNLREGIWLMDYITNRLSNYYKRSVSDLGLLLSSAFSHVAALPNWLIPCYFDGIVKKVYDMLYTEMQCSFRETLQETSKFEKQLLANSVIFIGCVTNCCLPPLHDSVIQTLPPWIVEDMNANSSSTTLAAGLPFFCNGMMRTWGRQTFIAFRGLLLLTGRYDEAKVLLLTFASVIRYGLIPNVFGGWNSEKPNLQSRYNSRDAVWWWLSAIQQYCLFIGDKRGDFLLSKVIRLYPVCIEKPKKMSNPNKYRQEVWTLHQIVYEVLSEHGFGINFVEWLSGNGDLSHPKGYKITAGIIFIEKDILGFPYGGNRYNANTWMDKVGSCEMTGNKNIAATSRDGAAVEIVGLCYAVINWIDQLHQDGHFVEPGISIPTYKNGKRTEMLTWRKWKTALEKEFEKYYWIPDNDTAYEAVYNAGAYKDLICGFQRYPEYHFRPNFLITMVLAPQLFNVQHAWNALQKCRHQLLGKIGMRSVAKNDYRYRGWCDENFSCHDFYSSLGFNYQQGPEWIWLTGYYLRAYLLFAYKLAKQNNQFSTLVEARQHVYEVLARIKQHMEQSPWCSLPNMTNEEGLPCPTSCPAYATSAACILEALNDLHQMNEIKSL